MQKKILSATLLFLINLGGYCQTDTFYEAISLPYGYSGIWDMTKTSDKNILLLSASEEGLSLLLKVDTIGNILWQKDLIRATPEGGFPQKVIETTDSAIIVLSNISNYLISIVKLDKNGNFIWAKQSEHGNPNLCSDITATENGGFATVSNGCTWSQLITKFNSDGDILWQKYCPNDSQILTSLSFIIHNKDHSLVVSGVGGNTSYNGLCLFSLNSAGDLQWYKTFQFPGNIEHKGLIASLNGGYALTGNANPNGSFDYRPFLLHTDNTGNLLWAKKYDNNFKSTPNAILQLADSGYVLTGNINYTNSLDVQMLNIKTDQNGNLLWGHSFGNYLYNGGGYDDFKCSEWIEGNNFYSAGCAENAVFTKNNGIIGTGSCGYLEIDFTTVPIPISQEAPLNWCYMRNNILNADTFSTVNSNYTGTIYCATEVAVKATSIEKGMVVYPNPLKSSAYVEFDLQLNDARLEIFNIQGFNVKTVRNISSNSISLNRDNLPNGIYFMHLIENEKVISTGKLVIIE